MRTISHRELRNNSTEVLRAVGAGETIAVTNHGEVAAVLFPPSLTPYERLVAAGKVREPTTGRPRPGGFAAAPHGAALRSEPAPRARRA
jgi:prevent-host-death family protein